MKTLKKLLKILSFLFSILVILFQEVHSSPEMLLDKKNFLVERFSILIHGVYRKFHKNCMKTLKIENVVLNFEFVLLDFRYFQCQLRLSPIKLLHHLFRKTS